MIKGWKRHQQSLEKVLADRNLKGRHLPIVVVGWLPYSTVHNMTEIFCTRDVKDWAHAEKVEFVRTHLEPAQVNAVQVACAVAGVRDLWAAEFPQDVQAIAHLNMGLRTALVEYDQLASFCSNKFGYSLDPWLSMQLGAGKHMLYKACGFSISTGLIDVETSCSMPREDLEALISEKGLEDWGQRLYHYKLRFLESYEQAKSTLPFPWDNKAGCTAIIRWQPQPVIRPEFSETSGSSSLTPFASASRQGTADAESSSLTTLSSPSSQVFAELSASAPSSSSPRSLAVPSSSTSLPSSHLRIIESHPIEIEEADEL